MLTLTRRTVALGARTYIVSLICLGVTIACDAKPAQHADGLASYADAIVPDTLSIVAPIGDGWLAQIEGSADFVYIDTLFRLQRVLVRRGQGPGEYQRLGWISSVDDTAFV